MNNENKQKDIRWVLHNNNIGVFGLVETRVRSMAINKVHQGLGLNWAMVNNNIAHDGGRIWILWDDNNYEVEILSIEAQVIHTKGSYFTWNNKHEPGAMVFSRIDRAMTNNEWLIQYPETVTMFHPEGLFDHCPCTITMRPTVERKIGSFKYFNMWGSDPGFRDVVTKIWEQSVDGYKMFQVVKKLKLLKYPLRQLNGSAFANIETTANVAKMLTIKARRVSNRVLSIHDMNGNCCTTIEGIEQAFIKYYHNLLGSSKEVRHVHIPTVRKGKVLSHIQYSEMCRAVTGEEIKKALFSIPSNKVPGPGGFLSQFFKDTYDIIREDIISVVLEFFHSGKMLKQTISKVICNRLADVLPEIISANQSAFIKGRDIVDNILICHDLARLYNRKACSPRSIMKIDLKKAYDSIEWSFIKKMLQALGFLAKMVQWIMMCVSTPWYTLSLNGASFDDLLMFCKGDRQSIIILLRAFATFSAESGLVMNREKSDIYFNGMRQEEIDYVLNISGVKIGSFSFRVERLCRNYLWSGSDQYLRVPAVAWEKICQEKKCGGLGVVNCRNWNLAMLDKYVWWIANKADHLWIRWVNHIYIKNQA
ncbi:uncharacterized protein LOC141602101 [Silene latifolia]|uniref:uncharacterized protein LOC141602101 n=1 Tax=Silene latifolia TaxID=37657 RepID=UPI003D789C98